MRAEIRSAISALALGLGLAAIGSSAFGADEVVAPAPVPATPPQTAPAEATPEAAAQESASAGTGEKAPAADPVGVGSGWTAEVAPGAQGEISLDASQTETVKKVSDYFNRLGDLTGAFVQTTSDTKPMKGKFYVKRPGRFRFDYSLPSKQVIISDGEYLAIQDLDLNNEDRVALDQTPFRLLLRKDVDLLRDARIVEVQESEDLIVLALVDKSPDTSGKIKLFFSTKPELELKEWVTTDAQGLDTRVEVSQLVLGEKIDVSKFKIQPVNFNKFHP